MTLLLDPTSVKRRYLARLGCAANVYIDTVYVWLKAGQRSHPKFAGLVQKLYEANQRPEMGDKPRLLSKHFPRGLRITLHQPTRQAVEVLHRLGLELSRVHLAVDMEPDDGDRVFRMALMKWRGDGKQKKVGNGTYWSSATTKPDPRGKRKLRARNITYYDDRPSKVTGQPCGHFEFRLNRSATLKTAGLRQPAALLDDSFDLEQFLTKQLKLRRFGKRWYQEQAKLAANMRKRRGRRKLYRRWKIDNIIAFQAEARRRQMQRLAQDENHTPHYPTFFDIPAQVIHDHAPEHLKDLLESP